MFGLKTIVGLQELKERNTILTNFCLMAMQCSPAFYKHVTLTAKDLPYVSLIGSDEGEIAQQTQVLNEYQKIVEQYKRMVETQSFFLIRTS